MKIGGIEIEVYFSDRFISLILEQNSGCVDERSENIRENQIRVV